jgi:ABC-type uncharacterized transport system auxiliary subunit
LLATGILVSLVACSAQPPVPEDNFYHLPRVKLQSNQQAMSGELAVKRLVTDGLHSERAMLYSESGQDLQLKQYHYHHWTDSPPRMLQEHLISALRSASVASTVVNYDPAQRNAYTLSGKIRHFEQVGRGKNSEVLVGLELRLDDKNGKPVLLKDYHYTQAANSSAPHDLVIAFGAALNKIYVEFISDLAKK